MFKVLDALLEMTNAYNNDAYKGKSAKSIVDSMMKKLDKNGDGLLQLDEFVDGCLDDELIRKALVDPMFNC